MSTAVAVTTILFLLVIVDILGNSLVCAIIRKHRDMRTPMNLLLFNLAVADAMYAAFITPKLIVSLNLHHPTGLVGSVLCILLTGGAFAWVGAICAILTLVAIAIERYYAVVYPLGNKWRCTHRDVKVIVACSWIFSMIYNVVPIVVTKLKNNICASLWPERWMAKAYVFSADALVFGALLAMVLLYSRVVYTLWFKSNDVHQVNHQQSGVMKHRKRATLTVVIVSVVFGICWGMIQVLYTLLSFTSFQTGPVLIAISNVMVLFNSAVNPFVYALFNQNFREKMKGMVFCSGDVVVPALGSQNVELANIRKWSNTHD